MGVSLHAIVLLKSTVARAPRQANVVRRAMASSTTHEERTAAQSRGPRVHAVTLDRIEQVNHNIRLLQLRPQSHTGEKSLQARPSGQWLDVLCPGIRQAGGFTITSTPQDLEGNEGYLELAIQYSPGNPPAAWLWQKEKEILGSELLIRVGGSFVWPPPGVVVKDIKKVVFVAGGVGINPLMSMITHLIRDQDFRGLINLQYSFRKDGSGDVSSVLFMARIRDLFERQVSQGRHSYILWSTGPSTIYPNSGTGEIPLKIIKERDADLRYVGAHQTIEFRRFDEGDLIRTLGPVKERNGVVAYVCGPPPMTDYVVESLRKADGMDETRVLCEKWW